MCQNECNILQHDGWPISDSLFNEWNPTRIHYHYEPTTGETTMAGGSFGLKMASLSCLKPDKTNFLSLILKRLRLGTAHCTVIGQLLKACVNLCRRWLVALTQQCLQWCDDDDQLKRLDVFFGVLVNSCRNYKSLFSLNLPDKVSIFFTAALSAVMKSGSPRVAAL